MISQFIFKQDRPRQTKTIVELALDYCTCRIQFAWLSNHRVWLDLVHWQDANLC